MKHVQADKINISGHHVWTQGLFLCCTVVCFCSKVVILFGYSHGVRFRALDFSITVIGSGEGGLSQAGQVASGPE